MSASPFDPSKFTAPAARPLPVVLLLDCSGSMSGEKINNLNDAVRDMLEVFSDAVGSEIDIHVAVITFGAEVKLHQPLVSANAVQPSALSAAGATPLGTALRMAKAMIEDKSVVPSRAYRPTVVLVSDGKPTDSWEEPLRDFAEQGRSAKCDRMAMAIGADADEEVLGRFIEGASNPLFYAENAKQFREFFQYVTMSVTTRIKSPVPDIMPDASSIGITPTTIKARPEKVSSEPQDATKQSTMDEQPSEEGYW